MIDLRGKTAIVTGASRGLGKSIALELASAGANLVLAARSLDTSSTGEPGTLLETASEIEALGSQVVAVKADITRDEDIEAVVKSAISTFGRIDIVVNNAGIGIEGDIESFLLSDFDKLLNLNLRAAVVMTKSVLETMKQQGSGAIVNISSILADELADDHTNAVVAAAAESSGIGVTAYGMTKAALIRFTTGAAADLASTGITVNCLKPSWIDTEGLRRWFPDVDRSNWSKPEAWGRLVVLLASDSGKEITGQILEEKDLPLYKKLG